MKIRLIKPSDAKEFLDLCKHVEKSGFMLYEAGERTTTVEQQVKAIEGILAQKKSTVFVAEAEEGLVGYLMIIGGTLKRIQHKAYLVLGVDENYRGQGVATRLFHQAFTWAKEKEITRLELTVMKHNTKAFNLYRKMGFIIEGEKVNSLMIEGEPVNEYYLYKLL
ncbi:GNAT family N-acetyltransferase [Ornithinibacillus xuwenensis]|uniref:GNAT family N-acetyltransferase n=1 Tax=Ornithinibacillus xuwenensis TaxID=3144668 RepID=A0ABU9XLT1_9BACI